MKVPTSVYKPALSVYNFKFIILYWYSFQGNKFFPFTFIYFVTAIDVDSELVHVDNPEI